ncbi:hypothetical protein [Phaeovulum sp.]|uniref:hypothetical protein n=1 Tax=Phaeovulum sp. TaxID=2934796 RepID=UPI0039E64D20
MRPLRRLHDPLASLPAALAFGALMLASLPAHAQDALNAEAFDARTVGRTITYNAYGTPYGVEQYLPGRKVVWAFAEGQCKTGFWFEKDGLICFSYENDPILQCWTFHDTAAGLTAYFNGDRKNEPLVSLRESPEPLICTGPDVGV